MKFLSNLFHKPSFRTMLITAVAGGVSALAHAGVIPVSPSAVDGILVVLGIHAKA